MQSNLRAAAAMATVSTPCTKVCALDPVTRLCSGCGRTAAEIGRWSAMSEDERRAVMARLSARRAAGGPVAPRPGTP